MKILKRLFTLLLALFILCAALIVVVPIIYKKEIVSLIKKDINQSVNADVYFDENVSVSLIKTFPNLSIQLTDLHVTGRPPFEADTLLRCKKIRTTVALKPLFTSKHIDLQYVELNKPFVQLLTKEGFNNWDIIKSTSTDSTALQLDADFKNIAVNQGQLTYSDPSISTRIDLNGITGSFKGNHTDNIFDLLSRFDCNNAFISYDNIPYVNHIPITTEAVTSIDFLTDTYTFKENAFRVGTLEIIAEGGLTYADDSIEIDITYASNEAKFSDLVALTPAYYTDDMKDFQMSGDASVRGTINGIISEYRLPGYTFTMALENGKLAHPDMVSPLQDIRFNLDVKNDDGTDQSIEIELSDLFFNLNKNPFKANIYTKDIYGDPSIHAHIVGSLELDELNKLIPPSYNTTIGGKMNCDLALQGLLSNIESSQIQKVNTVGSLSLLDVTYTNSELLRNSIQIKKGEFDFNENAVDVTTFETKSGKSNFMLTGQLKNWLGYLFNDQNVTGVLTASSTMFDVNDFTPKGATVTEQQDSFITLPDNLSINIVYDIEELQYDEHSFSHVVGEASIAGKSLTVKELSTNLFDGQVLLTGLLNTVDPLAPLADLNITVQNLSVQKAFTNFETLRKITPVFEQIDGQFSSTVKLQTELLKDFSPNLSHITCQGILDLFNCDIESLTSLSTIGSKLELDAFRKPFNIKDLLVSFSIVDGKVEVNPFSLPIGESSLSLAGYSKLDKVIHFDGLLSVPKKLYTENKNGFNQYIPKSTLSNIDSLEWSDLEFDLNIGGTYIKPVVVIDFKSTKNRAKENIKSQVKSKVDSQKEILKKQAEDEMAAAKKRAEEAKRIAEEKARQALKEQKQRIEEQLKKEKEAANKKLEEELRKKKEELLKNKFPIKTK